MNIRFSIATFNLWKNCGDFPKRIFDIAQYLKDIDCVCLQEDYHDDTFSSSDEINKNLGFYKISLPLRSKIRDGKISSSNLTILSKYKINLLDIIYFNKNQNDERGGQIVQIEHNGKKILIVNTHLTNLSLKLRMEQIRIINFYLQKFKGDITIICGDMNATENSREIKKIKRCGYNSQNKLPTYQNNLILDYIFYKTNLELEVESVISIKNLSDHYCLRNSFQWH